MRQTSAALAALALGLGACVGGRGIAPEREGEARVHARLEALRGDPEALRAFLRSMPKGGDLHSHTWGAIAPETLLEWGAEDGVCVDPEHWVASQPCAPGSLPLAQVVREPASRAAVLGAWSLEGFSGSVLQTHQHFFDTFARYDAVQRESRDDDGYAHILSSARQHQLLYVELMQGFGANSAGKLATGLFSATDPWDEATLRARREQLLALPAFQSAVDTQARKIARDLTGARALLQCGTAQADPGCDVELRLIAAANRLKDRAQVFAQWVYAYELARRVPQIVGVNLVAAEESAPSLRHYEDEMFALGVLDDLHEREPGHTPVHISLHAGELIPAVLAPQDARHLRFHVRAAVERGHAERIGHGVTVRDETEGGSVEALLERMRESGVLVEICLTSNRRLLGVAGSAHPLRTYLAHGVPVALATDDAGTLRNDLTQEYVAAVVEQGLDYATLKRLSRASLEHAFVEGDSLWARRDDFSTRAVACVRDVPGEAPPSAGCAAFLAAHRRAALQWKLEQRLAAFETRGGE
jgi:adenosine deaminase